MAPETHEHSNTAAYYVKIWAILLVLLAISIIGPFAGIRELTILTAFGVAIIKAVIVASEFMHLRFEKNYMIYLMLAMVLMMGVFYFGVAPDVMTGGGQNWLRKPIDAPIHMEAPEAGHGEVK